ncbi:MAG TPA: Wzz/FepE/Etk N-terminal domain-containing protein [Candidatus Limnocylindrales bacterium]|nr:Wzz/FepE/Etk N-terminal domain-containing protein [Candidatus Limnocylindrales bacterium]
MAEVSEKSIVGRARSEDKDERDLMEYLKVLWKWKSFILGGTILFVIIAVILNLVTPKVYRATISLFISNPDKSYAEAIKSQAVMARVLERLQLDKPPYQIGLENLTRIISVEPIPKMNRIDIIVDHTDPEKVGNIAHAVAISAVELNQEANEKEIATAMKNRDSIKDEMEEINRQLAQVEQELLTAQSMVEVTRLKKEILMQKRKNTELGLLETNRTIEEKSAIIATLTKKLGEEKKTLWLSRSLSNDPILQDSVKETSGLPASTLLSLQIKDEQINPLHAIMEPKLVETLADLESLKVRKLALVKDLEDNDKQIAELQKELIKEELELWNITRHYNSLEENSKSLKEKWDQIQTLVNTRKSQLEMANPVVVSKGPVNSNSKVNLLLAGAIGFFASLVILVFLLEYVTPAVKSERQSNPV